MASPCVAGEVHPPSRRRRDQQLYWFFQAASDGCLPCVRRMLQEDGSLGHVTLETQNYTALDFARWSEEQGVAGARDVVECLAPSTAAEAECQPDTEQADAPPEPASECNPGPSHPPPRRRLPPARCRLGSLGRPGR